MPILTQHQREKLAYQYTMALEYGDMDNVVRILDLAEGDTQLEQMIIELNQQLESELSITPSTHNQEAHMPVFTRPKRKHQPKRPQWTTAVAAVIVSLVFSGFALFFATQPSNEPLQAGAEDVATTSINHDFLVSRFLTAWNDNNPAILDELLADDFQYFEVDNRALSAEALQSRITEFNEVFGEIHFSVQSIIHFSRQSNMPLGTSLTAKLDLKAMPIEDKTAFDLQYRATGFITFTLSQDHIHRVDLDIDLDKFSAEYGIIKTDVQNDLIVHTVQEGETMVGILSDYGLNHTLIPAILEYNGFDGEDGIRDITVGTILQIPSPNSTLILTPPDDFDATARTDHIEITEEGVKGLYVSINAGESNLRLGTLPDTIFMADIENFGDYESVINGSRVQLINLTNHPYRIFDENGERPTWYFKVSDSIFSTYNIRGGDGDMMLDMRDVNLQGLQLSVGAAEVTLDLPDTGTNYEVVIEVLSDEAVINLDYPKHVAMRIAADDGIWHSRNAIEAESGITLRLEGSLSVLNMLDN